MMVHHSRIPAAAILLALFVLGVWPLLAHRSAGSVDDTQLLALQEAVAQPGAKAADWQRFAEKLQALGRDREAVQAYQRVLEKDESSRPARLQCALCLARVGDRDVFYAFMRATLAVNPKLTVEVLDRPEAQPYYSEQRFQALRREAAAQSMD